MVHTAHAALILVIAAVAAEWGISKPRLVISGLPVVGDLKMDKRPGWPCSSGAVDMGSLPMVITIQPGLDADDLLLVCLHELAHTIVPLTRQMGADGVSTHTKAFYLTAGRLYYQYDIPLSYALRREEQNQHAAQVLPYVYANMDGYRSSLVASCQ